MRIVTHDSSFHTDDVFAVATLLLVLGEAEVIRSRDPEIQATADYLVDTGMKYDPANRIFDHHQSGGAGIREDGIPYASFGLVWKEYGEKLTGGKEESKVIEQKLVMPIDAHDNGVTIAEYRFEGVREYAIGNFLATFEDFMEAVKVAKEVLTKEIALAKKLVSDREKILNAYEESPDKRLIILDEDFEGWNDVLRSKPEPLYVIYPRPDKGFTLQAVQEEGFKSRKPLPASWRGHEKARLEEITGVPGAIFCHREGFMATNKTKEAAEKLAEIALNS